MELCDASDLLVFLDQALPCKLRPALTMDDQAALDLPA